MLTERGLFFVENSFFPVFRGIFGTFLRLIRFILSRG